jgi:hypothetical protein
MRRKWEDGSWITSNYAYADTRNTDAKQFWSWTYAVEIRDSPDETWQRYRGSDW